MNISEGIYFLLQTATWVIGTIIPTITLVLTFASMHIWSAITKDNNLLFCHKSWGLESLKQNKVWCDPQCVERKRHSSSACSGLGEQLFWRVRGFQNHDETKHQNT